MRWFGRKEEPAEAYDPAVLEPVIRSSICTGEKVAGFREVASGRFREVMLVRGEADLKEFRKRYGISGEIRTVY
ncbi:MAG: aspartate dehydrogenase [Lachnospiraceae bacterium]|nr:aspartate dehydrogenase [Lachnospiraceae bacterium]MBQ9593279.1 aspartate dehydrogenase [Lachnospiraceae bacterium]MBR0153360.1 aspartate dehydrogenase [Lachnospiraceae bacterium]